MLLNRGVVLPLAALLLTACSSSGSSPADAGRRDTGRDSAAFRDSARPDTSVRDTGTRADTGAVDSGLADAGPQPLLSELEWVRLEGQPAHCIVERAVNPREVFEMRWLPCPGVEGCRYLDSSTTPLNFKLVQLPGTYDGTEAYVLASLRQSDGTNNHVVLVIGVDTGTVLALRTLRKPSQRFACGIGNVALGGTSYGLVVNDVVNDFSSFYQDIISSFPTIGPRIASFRGAEYGGSVATLAVSDTTLAGQLQPGGRVFVVDGTRTRIIEPGEGPLRGNPQAVHVSGHDVIWEDWPGVHDTRLVHATIDSGPELLVAPGPGVDVKSSFLSTSGWLAWMQGSEITAVPATYTYGRIESWVADTRDMTSFRPRLLAVLDSRPLLPNDGPETYVADAVIGPDGPTELTTTGEDSFRMYDLARRERRLFRKFDPVLYRNDFRVGDLVAESPTELFFNAGVGSPRRGTYIRLDKSVWLSSPAESLPDTRTPP